jgi:hypothetical protein
MKRNKKFLQEKELRRLDREERKYWNSLRSQNRKSNYERYGVGYRREVSKTLTPDPLYADLHKVVEDLHKVYSKPSSFKTCWEGVWNSEDFRCYLDEPMLDSYNQNAFDNLTIGQQCLLRPNEHSYRGEIYYTYILREKYYKYLYVKEAPLLRRHYDYYWQNSCTCSEHARLRNKIERKNLRHKIIKLKHGACYYEDWGRDRRVLREQIADKEMQNDLNDYFEEREEQKCSSFSFLS